MTACAGTHFSLSFIFHNKKPWHQRYYAAAMGSSEGVGGKEACEAVGVGAGDGDRGGG
jgi:hypothetical protein